MPSRLEKIVDAKVRQAEGVVKLPKDIGAIQVVLDRQPFEDSISKSETACSIDLHDDETDNYLGGATFAGGRVDGNGTRQGQRMLWSFARWPINGERRVRYVLTAPKEFQCRLDIDLFTMAELG